MPRSALTVPRTAISTPRVAPVPMAYSLRTGNGRMTMDTAVMATTASPWAISFWMEWGVYPAIGAATAVGIFNLKSDDAGAQPFCMFHNQGAAVIFGTNDASTVRFTATGFNPRSLRGWHHVVVTYDGVSKTSLSSYAVYLDGVLKSISATSAFTVTTNISTFGILGSTFTYTTGMCYTRVRIWQGGTAMTAEQAQLLYLRDEMPSGPTLFREFLCTDGSGTTVTDSSGNAQNATIASASVAWQTNVPFKTQHAVASVARTVAS